MARTHVFDKCFEIDITWAEFEALVDAGEVIEEHLLSDLAVKQIRLLAEWTRPLHVVYFVHHDRMLVVFRTLYEPTLNDWFPGYRSRRRR